MKKTSKIKTRIIAGVLSAITVFSVGTMAIGSASAATIGDPYGDACYQAGMGIIRQYLPGGVAIAGVIDSIIGSMSGGPSLSDISKQVSDLREDMDKQFNELKGEIKNYTVQIENKITDQTIIAN